ncbi:ankyrin repeat domain-containing protein [Isosphaeraceae bacterium EP7]
MSDEWFQAVERDDTEAVLDMLGRGTDVNVLKNSAKDTALMLAVQKAQISMIEILLRHGANTNLRDSRGYSAVTLAVILSLPRERHHWKLPCPEPRPLEMLLAAGGRLGIIESVLLNDLDLARKSLDGGDDPNEGEWQYHGPVLTLAARLGYLEMINLLIDRGANVEAMDDLANRPLRAAASYGQLESVRLLLDRGADIDATDGNSRSALTNAVFEGHREVAEFLRSRGARVGIVESVSLKDEALLEEALKEQDELGWIDDRVNAIQTFAGSLWSAKIVQHLLDHGPINLDDPWHMAAAAMTGDREILRMLLDRGADVNADHFDMTPLDWAIREGHDEAAAFLEERGAKRGPTPSARD